MTRPYPLKPDIGDDEWEMLVEMNRTVARNSSIQEHSEWLIAQFSSFVEAATKRGVHPGDLVTVMGFWLGSFIVASFNPKVGPDFAVGIAYAAIADGVTFAVPSKGETLQ